MFVYNNGINASPWHKSNIIAQWVDFPQVLERMGLSGSEIDLVRSLPKPPPHNVVDSIEVFKLWQDRRLRLQNVRFTGNDVRIMFLPTIDSTWTDIPQAYRKVDTAPSINRLMSLFNSYGFTSLILNLCLNPPNSTFFGAHQVHHYMKIGERTSYGPNRIFDSGNKFSRSLWENMVRFIKMGYGINDTPEGPITHFTGWNYNVLEDPSGYNRALAMGDVRGAGNEYLGFYNFPGTVRSDYRSNYVNVPSELSRLGQICTEYLGAQGSNEYPYWFAYQKQRPQSSPDGTQVVGSRNANDYVECWLEFPDSCEIRYVGGYEGIHFKEYYNIGFEYNGTLYANPINGDADTQRVFDRLCRTLGERFIQWDNQNNLPLQEYFPNRRAFLEMQREHAQAIAGWCEAGMPCDWTQWPFYVDAETTRLNTAQQNQISSTAPRPATYMSDEQPLNPRPGETWFRLSNGVTYTWVIQSNGIGAWIQ